MAVAIIGSGGDGVGMNECLYNLCKNIKGEVVLFNRGYQGVLDDDVSHVSLKELKEHRFDGGIVIKTSRCPEFKTEQGLNKASKVLKSHNVDTLIVMGGNGSLNGAKELKEKGINIVFIPTTIDNDVDGTDYCLGFNSACEMAIQFINDVDFTMQAFNRICIYEVMGRHCEDIAVVVSKQVNACYTYLDNSTKQDLLEAVKKALKNEIAPKIFMQENVISATELANFLETELKREVKVVVLGYIQRGGRAKENEIKMAQGFANLAAKSINKGITNIFIKYDKNIKRFETIDI